MTNLAAAVERVNSFIAREKKDNPKYKTMTLVNDLETILAELGSGAGGEVAATLIHSPDELTRVDISMHGMGLGYGKHDLFTRPPVAGLAVDGTELFKALKKVHDADGTYDDMDKAAREFLGKVDG